MYQRHFNAKGPRFSHAGRRPHAQRGNFKKQHQNRGGGEYIDPSKFIHKAIITEEVEHFVPEHQFTDFAIDEELKRAVVAKGYTTPTPIQDRAIPHVLKGSDVVGIANTGTGKTAAFLIPLIHKVRRDARAQVLIVVPTRELAIQIDAELKGFTKGMKLFSVVCVGGASIGPQLSALRYRNQFVIGTPGRLKDLIERGKIRLADYGTIVLDEADRMLDMGFVNDMRFVMQGMPKPRHTLFFSATLSREIEALIGEFLHEPVRISVKTGDTSKNVDQDVVRVAKGAAKLDVLHDLLTQKEFNKVLVFGRTKHGVERLAKTLNERGFRAESIHGNKNHSQRQRALNAFKENKVQILVATDVAARGLDIKDVSHVINYDLPQSYDDYVHRIGRAGRAGKYGKALTFVE
jgi:superfamily II DNA/RNA helicase